MNGNLLTSWYVRAALVGFGTWLAYKHLPLGVIGKTVTLAVGGVATTAIVAGNLPALQQLLAGNIAGVLPAPAATA